MQLSILSKLPKTIENFGESIYSLEMYVTAWNHLCICYSNVIDRFDRIFSIVIEEKAEKFTTNEPYEISTVNSLDEAVKLMVNNLYDCRVKELDPDLIVKYCVEHLDLDFNEENARECYA